MRGRLVAAYVLLAMALLATRRGWGQQATLVGDAHVSSAQPTVNAGYLSNLDVGGVYTALVQFDLGTLPAGTTAAQITKATLRVFCNRADVPGTIAVQAIGGAWTESTVTYATLPALGATVQTGTVAGAGQFVTFDVTSTVQGWVSAPATNFGLALTGLAGSSGAGAQVQFDSKENDQTSHEPELQIALAAGSGGGTVGVAGATGATGATGPQGTQGVQGVAGATGAQGPQGLPGVSGTGGGIAYQGTYDAATSYGVGDVVEWAGSSWVSLITANVGNVPVQGSAAWGLMALAGAQGAVGATGVVGPQGLQGPAGIGSPGPAGAVGAMGAAGATGATGSPGLVYQGAYSSTGNYGLGDVVAFQGSSWVSLVAFNVGQTPGASPSYWGMLTQQGPAGAIGAQGLPGPMGATGALGPVGPAGEMGAQGLQGTPGEAGAQGIPGAAGATGLQGPMGPEGSAGPVGLSFMGAYDSTVNYGLGDGVTWQGAGWVSLIAGNQGNTPSSSPEDWAMFASSGAAGATGATGPAGAPGLNGMNGAAGATGPSGATGSMGAAGAPGLVYQGAYSSTVNYALGDVVVFDGASWVSQVGQNVGQTPAMGSAYWGVLTSVGAMGPVGATGALGPAGPQGVAGLTGPAGAQGVAGAMGVQGPAGPQGLMGTTGAAGSAGAQGLQGVAGAAGAQGIPGATGAAGLQGPAGPLGATGAMGPAGADGTNGVNGTPGMAWQGAWSSAANYALNDAVSYAGTSYLSLTANNMGQQPNQYPASWAVLAQAGAEGADGATGAAGAAGEAGPAGAAGTQGPAGSTGAAGAPGVNFVGVWSSATNYAVNDAVTFAGSTYLAQAAGSNEEPDLYPASWTMLAQAGSVGPAGAQGAAATVAVGTVTTLAAGAQATVTNSGTSQAAVLNFGIPQGAAGSSGGSESGGGASSGSFAAMYHAVSDATMYYAVNSPTASAIETGGAVLAWIPQGCTATELDVYSQQSASITVTLRTGLPGALANTTLACSPATNGSCTATGSVAIAAGDFIDLQISPASGVVAGVWTSLQCQ